MNEAGGRVHIDDEDPSARRAMPSDEMARNIWSSRCRVAGSSSCPRGLHYRRRHPLTEGQLTREILRSRGRRKRKMLVDEVQKGIPRSAGIHASWPSRSVVRQDAAPRHRPGPASRHRRHARRARRPHGVPDAEPPRRGPLRAAARTGRQMLMALRRRCHGFVASMPRPSSRDHPCPDRGRYERQVGLPRASRRTSSSAKPVPAGTGLSRYNDVITAEPPRSQANSNYLRPTVTAPCPEDSSRHWVPSTSA